MKPPVEASAVPSWQLEFAGEPRWHVAVSGASGLVGGRLVPFLERAGHRVSRLVRRAPAGDDEIRWDPTGAPPDPACFEGIDAVVHLAGENIAARRWSDEQKMRIRDSRVQGTHALVRALSAMDRPPRVLLASSAIGYYGDRGDELLDESSSPGSGFLAETCVAWEDAASEAMRSGVRVVRLRTGAVLAREGGLLERLVPIFRRGVGGRVGNGRQYVSWIALDDWVGAAYHALMDDRFQGAVNLVAPEPITNAELMHALGEAVGRPAWLALPAPLVRLAFGQMGQELLLASQRVAPRRLELAGFAYHFPDAASALRAEVGG